MGVHNTQCGYAIHREAPHPHQQTWWRRSFHVLIPLAKGYVPSTATVMRPPRPGRKLRRRALHNKGLFLSQAIVHECRRGSVHGQKGVVTIAPETTREVTDITYEGVTYSHVPKGKPSEGRVETCALSKSLQMGNTSTAVAMRLACRRSLVLHRPRSKPH
jgi:hypothetical protein